MNDDQKLNQNTNTPLVSPTDQSQVQNPTQIAQNQPQDQGVGSVHKEQGPVREFVEKSDVELKIDKELESIGVETKSDDVNLTPEHIKFGLEHAGSSVPASTSPSGKVVLPQTPKQIKNEATFTSQPPREKCRCQGLIAKRKAATRLNFSFFNNALARR